MGIDLPLVAGGILAITYLEQGSLSIRQFSA
jgi:hypothetical protein